MMPNQPTTGLRTRDNVDRLPRRNPKYSLLLVVLTGGYSVWALSPFLYRNAGRSVAVGILLIWMACALVVLSSRGRGILDAHVPKIVTWTAALLLWITFSFIRVSDQVESGNYWITCLYYFPILITPLFERLRSPSSTRLFIFGVIIGTTTTALSSIRILSGDPYASRFLTGSFGTAVSDYSDTNLATVPWVMSTVVLLPIMLGMIQLVKSPLMKTLLLVAFAIDVALVAIASSAIAAFVAALLVGFSVLRSALKRPIVALVGIGLLVSLSFLLFNDGLNFAPQWGAHYGDRVSEAVQFWNAPDVANGSLGARMADNRIGVSGFLENPVIGVGMVYGDPGANQQLGVGMHSEVLDDLGRYGIVGAIMLGGLYVQLVYCVKRIADRGLRHYAFVALGCAGLLSLLNPTTSPSFGLVLLGCLPAYASLAKERENPE